MRRFSTGFARLSKKPLFDPRIVPPPSELSQPGKKASSKWLRRGQRVAVVGALAWAYDKYFNASSISRSLRCIYDIMFIGIDYRLNFKEGRDIDALLDRSADRLYNLLIANKGLYIKMGQAIAVEAGIFPPSFQAKFRRLFDSAPQDPWSSIEALIQSELGIKSLSEVFDYFDPRCIASASIAQVHKARLRDSGEWVAVKVQHTELSKQVDWDLACYRNLMYIYGRFLFDIPLHVVAEHVSERLKRETNFQNEAQNSIAMSEFVAADPKLSKTVYIPKIYEEYTRPRLLVTEWIDGTPLNQSSELKKNQYSLPKAMDILIRLYSKQIFQWGLVHCDPHPGNIFLRYSPKGTLQVVLLDHGLYVTESEKFMFQYAQLWKGLFMFDLPLIKQVANEWGLGDPEMLASTTLLQLYKSGKDDGSFSQSTGEKPMTFEDNERNASRMKDFIKNTEKFPLELIFMGRTMRILQGVNAMMGSPVNRIRIFATEAIDRLKKRPEPSGISLSLSQRFMRSLTISFTLFLSDIYHYCVRVISLVFGVDPALEEQFEDKLVEDELAQV